MADNKHDYDFFSDSGSEASKRRLKNKKFEAWKTWILEKWLIAHVDNPYPTDKQKMDLALRLDMTKKQVSYWFNNQRKVR